MIYCIIGHSASGKSTIERKLDSLGIPRIISYTTRPPRKGEKDGVDYHFITINKFAELHDAGFFAEEAKYRDWLYGLSIDGVLYKEKDYVVAVTPKGYYELLEEVGDEYIKAFFIQVHERDRLIRLAQRGDDVDEIIRRIQVDREDFKEFEFIADYVINNKNLDDSVDLVYTIIKR